MALTDNERAAVRLHLGYSNLDNGVAVGYGVAHVSPQYQAVDLAMAELRPDAEGDVRRLITELDEIDCAKQGLVRNLGLRKVESIEFSGSDGLSALNEHKADRAQQLADILGVVINPFSSFYQGSGGMGGGGVREGCW